LAVADIRGALEAAAAAQSARIEAEAARAADQILGAAEDDARAIRERHMHDIELPLQQDRARRLNGARMAALMAISQARERLFAGALQRAHEQLAGLRADPRYPAILRALAEEACAQVGGECVLHADARDAPQLRALLPDLRIECDLECWGGAAAATPDRRVEVINTLEARLEQAQQAFRPAVMQLFEDQAGDVWMTTTMPTHDFVR
jgi:vacuolar-type H+-ATPase subunit E/Vma4